MLARLKNLAAREMKLLKEPKRQLRIIALSGLLLAMHMYVNPSYLRPSSVEDYARTSVKVLSSKGGGGSGVILESHPSYSIILTNAHVCEGVVKGGVVDRAGYRFRVAAYKMSDQHDLCEVKVNANLGVNTKVADQAPKQYSDAYISGHPSLYPHVLVKGYFSGKTIIQMLDKFRPCTEDEFKKDPLMCLMAGWPVLIEREAQLVSALIAPGSSGSAVFDENGEIAGLAFAGRGRDLSYALVVPHEYIYEFVNQEASNKPWQLPAAPDFGSAAE